MSKIGQFGIGILVLVSLVIVIGIKDHKIEKLSKEISDLHTTVKAYDIENSGLENENRNFRLTMDQYTSMKDSLIVKMRQVQEELGVKDSKVKRLEYILSTAQRTDTVIYTDTIFREGMTRKDTVIGDKWFSVDLSLMYPDRISLTPRFTSELYAVTHASRETIRKRKKFFLWRLFQKKHTVLITEIQDKNPYVITNRTRFLEIVD